MNVEIVLGLYMRSLGRKSERGKKRRVWLGGERKGEKRNEEFGYFLTYDKNIGKEKMEK